MDFFEELKRRAEAIRRPRLEKVVLDKGDLVGLLRDKLGYVKIGGGDELSADCPFCGHRGKLSINTAKRCWHCWHCDERGTLSKLLGMDVVVHGIAPVREERKPTDGTVYPPSIDESGLLPLASLPDDNPAVVYVRSRGFDPEELDRDFALRYCSIGRKFAKVPFDASNTLVIPVYSGGTMLGWQARLLYDPKKVAEDVLRMMGYTETKSDGSLRRPPKYLTSPGLNKGNLLYNIDWARKSDTVVVTEGVFDCIRVGRRGVATFGKTVSDEQKRLLVSTWKTIVLLLDPDAADDQERLARELTVFGGPRIVKVGLSGYKDAGECPREELWRQIDAALKI